jgi:Omp85 superfamily domain/Calcineurin-like phosphoesterase
MNQYMKISLLLCLILFSLAAGAQDTVMNRIIVVGDAGSLKNGRSPVIDVIKKKYALDKKTTVIFLGDNLYDYGLPNEYNDDYLAQKEALDSQILIANGREAKVYMIPGNHDWSNGNAFGQETVTRQQMYVDFASLGNVKFYPERGCPGPVEVPLGDSVVLVVFDSQWWLHPYAKPGVESDCPEKTNEQVIAQLEDIVNKNYKKLLIFACHHPFKSNGVHGGYFTIKEHIFPFTAMNKNAYIPLPVIGSAYPIARSVFGTPQDIKHPLYQKMIFEINKVLKGHPHVVRVHGHEHNLQLIQNDSLLQIISGSGSKIQRVSPGGDAKYIAQKLGFAEIEVSYSKWIRVKFFEVDNVDSVKTGFDEIVGDFIKQPELFMEDTTIAVPIYSELVKAPASLQYKDVSGFKRLMNGNNYRAEWSTPVAFKVFDINNEKGGFKITGIGGGKQTKSLRLEDKNGREWALRTIDKDPEEAIPENFKDNFAGGIVQDHISAAHPYAPLTVPTLAKAVGVRHSTPEFFYVPNDRALGYYRPLFAKKIAMLELRELDGRDTKSSYTVFNNMREDNEKTVDQQAMLKARLLDMLIGDFDRHFDQFKWVENDTGKGKIYFPEPRDRDQVYFNSDGVLAKIVSWRIMPFIKGFKRDIKDINEWNIVAKDVDRLFLNNINSTTWNGITKDFVEALPDTVIKQAVQQLPPEIYAISGNMIEQKLIARRDQMKKESKRYYKFLAKRVQVLGSNKNEYFHLFPINDSLKLDVFTYKNKDTSFLMYSRIFAKHETKELLLYGFGGRDVFKIDSSIGNIMKIRLIGGSGEDSFLVRSPVKTYVYDNIKEKNVLEGSKLTRNRIDANVRANDYELRGYKYDQLRFPRFTLGYNADDRLFIGTGLLYRRYGFRKSPYASNQVFSIKAAVMAKALDARYAGEFVDFFRNTSLEILANVTTPRLDNFFGFGNNTVIDKTKGVNYYRVRYSEARADLLLKRKPFSKLSISFGPSLYYYWIRNANNRTYVLSKPSDVLLDSASVYTNKVFLGGLVRTNFNNLNSELFPTRGVDLNMQFSSMWPVQGKSHSVNKFEGDMTIYASLKDPSRIVTILKMGGGHIFDKNFEYFQGIGIGADNNLRGFRKNRFVGQSALFGSLEFRIKMLEGKSYSLPGQVGILVFGDAAKVWYPGANSRRFNTAYGGGLYYVPFNMVIISGAVAFSREAQLFNLSVGTNLNLTF